MARNRSEPFSRVAEEYSTAKSAKEGENFLGQDEEDVQDLRRSNFVSISVSISNRDAEGEMALRNRIPTQEKKRLSPQPLISGGGERIIIIRDTGYPGRWQGQYRNLERWGQFQGTNNRL